MKVFVVEPSRNGEKFEDCHIVAANSVQEVLQLLEKMESRVAATNWSNCDVRVWNLVGVEYDAAEPCPISCYLYIDASSMLRPITKKRKSSKR